MIIFLWIRSNVPNVVHAAGHRIQTALEWATRPWTLLVSNLASNARFHQKSMVWKRSTFKTHLPPLLPQSLQCICTSNAYSVSIRIHLLSPFTNYIKKSKHLSQLTGIIISTILILPYSQKPYNQNLNWFCLKTHLNFLSSSQAACVRNTPWTKVLFSLLPEERCNY